MSIRWIMGLSFMYIMAHICCWCTEAVLEVNEAQDTINGIGGFKVLEAQGLMGIPILSWEFFSHLPQILMFDYPFLDGWFSWIKLVFLAISCGVTFGLVQMALPAIQGVLSRLIPTWR